MSTYKGRFQNDLSDFSILRLLMRSKNPTVKSSKKKLQKKKKIFFQSHIQRPYSDAPSLLFSFMLLNCCYLYKYGGINILSVSRFLETE